MDRFKLHIFKSKSLGGPKKSCPTFFSLFDAAQEAVDDVIETEQHFDVLPIYRSNAEHSEKIPSIKQHKLSPFKFMHNINARSYLMKKKFIFQKYLIEIIRCEVSNGLLLISTQ